MDRPAGDCNHSSMITVEMLLEAVLALDEKESKKTFAAIQRELEKMAQAGRISSEAAKNFRQMKAVAIKQINHSPDKEVIMSDSVQKTYVPTDGAEMLSEAIIAQIFEEAGWEVVIHNDHKSQTGKSISMGAEKKDGGRLFHISIIAGAGTYSYPKAHLQQFELVEVWPTSSLTRKNKSKSRDYQPSSMDKEGLISIAHNPRGFFFK